MRGHPTLWLPGTDHAGIATQMLVERQLVAEGTSRTAVGRDAFLERVWGWKAEKGGQITGQIRRLGASCDWSREKFTLQPELCTAVTEAFVAPRTGPHLPGRHGQLVTLARHRRERPRGRVLGGVGSLYYFKYRLAEPLPPDALPSGASSEYVAVATTRPETILEDAAVSCTEDERYKHLIGRDVLVPILDKRIPIIADEYVQMDFGSGALKITPAHDVNDYAIGKRHELPMINIMNKDARERRGGRLRGARPLRMP